MKWRVTSILIAVVFLCGCGPSSQTPKVDTGPINAMAPADDLPAPIDDSAVVVAHRVSFTVIGDDDRCTCDVQLVGKYASIPTNTAFDMVVHVSSGRDDSGRGLTLRFDAAMPQHGHGMNVVPVVTRQRDGSFLVEGVLLHMTGRWELYFDVQDDGFVQRLQHVVVIE